MAHGLFNVAFSPYWVSSDCRGKQPSQSSMGNQPHEEGQEGRTQSVWGAARGLPAWGHQQGERAAPFSFALLLGPLLIHVYLLPHCAFMWLQLLQFTPKGSQGQSLFMHTHVAPSHCPSLSLS